MSAVRNHPLEGGGCRTAFFHFLAPLSGTASVVNVRIPTTVVYEHNCPRSWYEFDEELGEIRHVVGKDLQSSSILQYFSEGVRMSGRQLDVIATFTYVEARTFVGESVVSVMHLTRDALEALVMHPHPAKREGLLQRYVPPLGYRECVLQATSGPRVCIVRRRTSFRPLADTRYSIEERYSTFDGPEHLSIEACCAKNTVQIVNQACEEISDHLFKTQHLRIANSVMYFKLDLHGHPCLLWCGGLQFQGPHATPAAFLSEFGGARVHPGEDDPKTNGLLRELDEHQRQLMAEVYPRRRSPSPSRSRYDIVASPASVKASKAAALDHSAVVAKISSEVRSSSLQLCEKWYTASEEIEEEYLQVKEHEEAVRTLVEDTLYVAMSYSDDASELRIRFPIELGRYLSGQDKVSELMRASGLVELPSGEMILAARSVTTDSPQHVIPAVMSAAAQWIDHHFEAQLAALRIRALPHLQLSCIRQALLIAESFQKEEPQ